MPKTKISEFSSTPANNTDIDSINIAEGCAPSGINDAIRELMAQLKDWQSGTSNDPMVIGSSGSLTLNQGTANGVTYLNGSKVVTSGSALTFDGTTLGTSGLTVSTNRAQFKGNTSTGFTGGSIEIGYTGTVGIVNAYDRTASAYKNLEIYGNDIYNYVKGSNAIWDIAGVGETMRLTSTGLGIGTSSPSEKLEVVGNYIKVTGTTNQVALRASNTGGDAYFGIDNSAGSNFNTGTAYAGVVWRSGANPICFVNNSSEKMRLDSSGNLGLGVTPSAWWTGAKAFQMGAGMAMEARASDATVFSIGANQYIGTSATRIYLTTNVATLYEQNTGQHRWYTAPSGTAGNAISFTQAMTLDASGNLGIGTTSPSWMVSVRKDSASGGAGAYPVVQINNNNASGYAALYLNDSTAQAGLETRRDTAHLGMYAGGTERARIDSSGNLLVGTTSTSNGALINWYKASGTIETSLGGITTAQNHIVFANPNGNVGSIQVNGSATSYNTSSDYRLKNTIAPMTGALAKVALLKPCTYKWNVDGSEGEGFIAHELAEVVPQCVTGEKDAVDEDGNPKYQGIDTSFLVATLTAAIQELKAEFDAYVASHP